MIFVISDLHFGHKNIIKYENRPFENVEEMNKELIKKWNKKVKENDTIYILGDFCWLKGEETNKILEQLNGKKILIKGNHDRNFLNDKKFNKDLFEAIYDYLVIKDNKQHYVLFHYPIAEFDGKENGYIHLYGHIHDTNPLLEDKLKHSYNVGAIRHNFEPVNIEYFKEVEDLRKKGLINE